MTKTVDHVDKNVGKNVDKNVDRFEACLQNFVDQIEQRFVIKLIGVLFMSVELPTSKKKNRS